MRASTTRSAELAASVLATRGAAVAFLGPVGALEPTFPREDDPTKPCTGRAYQGAAYLPAARLNTGPRLCHAAKGPLCSLGQPSSPPPHQTACPPSKQGARGGQEARGGMPKRPSC